MGMESEGRVGKNTKRYIKWTLNLDSCTPDYVVYKETNVEKTGMIAECREQ